MKRLLLIVLMLMLVVVPAMGTTSPIKSNFQDYPAFSATSPTSPVIYGDWLFPPTSGIRSPDAYGRIYMQTPVDYWGTNYNAQPMNFEYAAFTFISGGFSGTRIQIYGASKNVLASYMSGFASGSRCEVIIDSSLYPNFYVDGVRVYTGSRLLAYPYYVGVYGKDTNAIIDDFVVGYSDDSTIIGSLPSDWFILYDASSPASVGLYQMNSTPTGSPILKNSNYFGVSYGRGSSSATTLQLIDPDGTVVKSYAVANRSCQCTLPISDLMVGGSIRNGLWRISLADSAETGYLFVLGAGAAGEWSQEQYASDATAAYTYTVTGTSWDPVAYTYRFDMFDVYGNVVYTSPITTQTGTKTITLDETTYPSGAYYGAVIRTSGSEDTWMTADLMEIVGYVFYAGYVNDAESATPITGANVSIAQGDIVYNALTPASGEYTTNSTFYSGIATIFNITAAGYYQYNATFTPASAGTKTLNFTLQSKTPTFTGIALGGTCRDSVYGRPINYCAVTVTNATYGESYSVTANNAGYYLLDESDGAHLTNGRWYSVAASKTGFSNSASYLKAVWGA